MTTFQVRKLYEARPFQAFRLRMADGRSIRVAHPEWMAFSPSGRSVIVHKRNDDYDVVDLRLVTSLDVGRNGRRKVRKK